MRKLNGLIAGLLLCLASFASLAAEPLKTNEEPLVLIWGDSLSAAYGLDVQAGWVALLRQRLVERGIKVANGSISGETTVGGLSRLPAALEKHRPSLVVLELGANDGLRGLPIGAMRANLQQMIDLSRNAGAAVVLLGMQMPPNYGLAYTQQFADAFEHLAEINRLPWVPFFLEGISEDFALMQMDNLHPNAKAQPLILERVWPVISPLLDALY